MKLIRLLLLRSLKERPLRILLSMFGIILGVAGILSMGITNQAAMAAITRLFSDTSGKANLVIVNASSDSIGLDESLIKVVNRQESTIAIKKMIHVDRKIFNGEVRSSRFFLRSFLSICPNTNPSRIQLASHFHDKSRVGLVLWFDSFLVRWFEMFWILPFGFRA